MASRSVHVVAHVRFSFLFLAGYYCMVWMDHILFICSFIHHGWPLGLFHLQAVVNYVTMNMPHTCICLCPCFQLYWVCVSRRGIAGSNSICIFNYLGSFHTGFHSGCTILHTHQQYTKLQLFHMLTSTCYFSFFFSTIPVGMK